MSVEAGLMEDKELQQRAKSLVNAMERADSSEVEKLIHELTDLSETRLYHQIGTLTRELHETVKGFFDELHASDITEDDMPDARDRLQHVIELTKKSAETTLDATDKNMPLAKEVGEQAQALAIRWQSFRERRLSTDEFKVLCADMSQYFELAEHHSLNIHHGLAVILMAQEYQDITGQIIQQVIKLIDEVEKRLLSILSLSGARDKDSVKKTPIAGKNIEAQGPVVPGQSQEGIVQGQDEVDDLLSSLGF